MNWIALESIEQLDDLDRESSQAPVLIFKHSSRCSISGAARARLERASGHQFNDSIKSYFLDLGRYPVISKAIEMRYDVQHESPQILLIRDGASVFSASHFEIEARTIEQALGERFKN